MLSKAESIHQVAIFGSSHTEENSALYNEAFAVCKKLAEIGYVVVDGGGKFRGKSRWGQSYWSNFSGRSKDAF